MALSKSAKSDCESNLKGLQDTNIISNADRLQRLESRMDVVEALENRINVLEAQLKREVDCTNCQKNRSIMKWINESSTSSSSNTSENNKKLEITKQVVLKRKHEQEESSDLINAELLEKLLQPYSLHHIKNGEFRDSHSRKLFIEDIVTCFETHNIELEFQNISKISHMIVDILEEECVAYFYFELNNRIPVKKPQAQQPAKRVKTSKKLKF